VRRLAAESEKALRRAHRIVRRRLRYLTEGYSLEPLRGDASTRHYFRLFMPRVPGFTSAVMMLFDRPFRVERCDYYQVSELLRKLNLPAPTIYESFGRDGAMLIEDLGDTTLRRLAAELEGDEGPLEEFYLQAVDFLVTLQSRAGRYADGVGAFARAFDVRKLRWELRFAMRHFARSLLGYRPGRAARAALSRFFDDLCRRIAALPRVLCHRDYHSRNLMVSGGRLRIIDFQDARLGPAVYDLVSLLRDSYLELGDGLRSRLLKRYLQRLPGRAYSQEAGTLAEQFNLVALQRHIKHLGTFGYQAGLGRRRYLRFVPPTFRYLEENLPNFPEYGDAVAALGELFELGRSVLSGEEEL